MTSSKYFRFPLRCLKLDKSLHEIAKQDREIVVNRCIHTHLTHAMKDVDTDEVFVIEHAEQYAEEHNYTTTNRDWSDDEIKLLYASRLSGVNHGQKHLPTLLRQIEKDAAAFGSGSFVVMPQELFWESVRTWNFREFAVLCSVWAAIGQATYRRVSFDKIIRGSLGYGKADDYAKLPKQVQPLTRQQVRATVDRLERRKFFSRCPVNRRHTAYSKKLGLTELQRAIAERNAKRLQPSQAERLREVERLTALIASSEAEKQPASKQQPKPPQAIQQPVEIEKPKSDRKATTPAKASKPEVSPAEKNVMARVPKIQPSDQEVAARIQALEQLARE